MAQNRVDAKAIAMAITMATVTATTMAIMTRNQKR